MAKFQVTVTDEAGNKLYDETIEADSPSQACERAKDDADTMAKSGTIGGMAIGQGAIGVSSERSPFILGKSKTDSSDTLS